MQSCDSGDTFGISILYPLMQLFLGKFNNNEHTCKIMNNSQSPIRLDKWLWAARFYKTRALAREMVDGGKVHYNGQRAKPSKIVEIGAQLKLRQGSDEKTITITALSEQRRSANEAQMLYHENEESIEKREKIAEARKLGSLTMPHPDRRPDKKERRHLIKFKHGE